MIMGDGLLSLSWNNHRSTFCHMLSTIRGLEKYSDVTLACDGRFYPAHKLVLSTCSDYFHKMFERTPCKHPIIVIKDVECKDIEALLSYMYAGIVNVSQSDLSQLIKAAELLEIKGLAVPDEPPSTSKRAGHTRSSSTSPHRKRRKQEESTSPTRHDTPAVSSASSRSSPPRRDFTHPQEQSASSRHPDRGDPRLEHEEKDKRKSSEGDREEQQPVTNLNTEQEEEHIANSEESSENQVDPLNNSIKEEKVEILSEGDGGMAGYEYGSLLGGLREEDNHGSGLSAPPPPYPATDHTFHTNPGPSGLQGWSGVGNGGESGQGYGSDLSQDLQLAGHLGSQAQQLHQVVGGESMGEWAGVSPRWRSLKIQSMRRLHQCPFCAYSSVFHNNLTKHVRTHTGEKPFMCTYCPFRTTQNSSLKRHMFNLHWEGVSAQEELPELHPKELQP